MNGRQTDSAIDEEDEHEGIGCTRPPLPQHGRLDDTRQRVPVHGDSAHHRNRSHGKHPTCAGEEPSSDRIGDEPEQIGETILSDGQEEQTREHAGESQQHCHGHERRHFGRADRAGRNRGAERAQHRRRHLLRATIIPLKSLVRAPNRQKTVLPNRIMPAPCIANGSNGPLKTIVASARPSHDQDRAHDAADDNCARQLGRHEVGAEVGLEAHAIVGRRGERAASPHT